MTRHNDIDRQEIRKEIKNRSIQYGWEFQIKNIWSVQLPFGQKNEA